MRLLVTGGTGFFGKALLRHWRDSSETPDEITILSRDPDAFFRRHGDLLVGLPVALVRADVTDPHSLPTKGDFTHLIHAAAESTHGHKRTPLDHVRDIVGGTKHVLDMAVRLEIPRLLYVSSGAVYGEMPVGSDAFTEGYAGAPDPLEISSAYGLAKRMSEHLSVLYQGQSGVEAVIARCFAFSGIDLPLDAHFAIGNFVRDVSIGRAIVVNGDGSPIRSYLDQKDLARWLDVISRRGEPGRAYNVGSNRALSIGELAELVTEIAGSKQPPRILGKENGSREARRSVYVPDVSRAREELGLEPVVSLESSVRGMVAAAQANRETRG